MTTIIIIGIALFIGYKALKNTLNKKELINLFENGSVMVFGLRGTGKDTLFNYVINKRKKKYISNVDYTGGKGYIKQNILEQTNCGGNTPKTLAEEKIIYYEYPYEDGIDYYISDAQAYFPSQDFGTLNNRYKSLPLFQGISRHLGACNVHCNTQNLNRLWDKFREQSDTYIRCRKATYKPWLKIDFKNKKIKKTYRVKLKYTIYDNYESALARLEPYPKGHGKEYRAQKANYEATHGNIINRTITFEQKNQYDSRIFKTMFLNGEKQ